MPFQPCHEMSGPGVPLALGGENCPAPGPGGFDIIWPNSSAMWFMVALLYGCSMQSTQLHDGPQLQTCSAGADVTPLAWGCV